MKKNNKLSVSAKELSSLRTITAMAMLMALSLVLNIFANIDFSDSLRLGFSFLATAMMGLLFGPVPAAIGAALVDMAQAFIKPTGPFFPGFTLTALLTGLVFGLFLYREKVTLLRLLFCRLVTNLLLNVVLNSIWLKILYDKAFWAMLPVRIIKNIAMLPVEVLLMFLILPNVRTILQKSKLYS